MQPKFDDFIPDYVATICDEEGIPLEAVEEIDLGPVVDAARKNRKITIGKLTEDGSIRWPELDHWLSTARLAAQCYAERNAAAAEIDDPLAELLADESKIPTYRELVLADLQRHLNVMGQGKNVGQMNPDLVEEIVADVERRDDITLETFRDPNFAGLNYGMWAPELALSEEPITIEQPGSESNTGGEDGGEDGGEAGDSSEQPKVIPSARSVRADDGAKTKELRVQLQAAVAELNDRYGPAIPKILKFAGVVTEPFEDLPAKDDPRYSDVVAANAEKWMRNINNVGQALADYAAPRVWIEEEREDGVDYETKIDDIVDALHGVDDVDLSESLEETQARMDARRRSVVDRTKFPVPFEDRHAQYWDEPVDAKGLGRYNLTVDDLEGLGYQLEGEAGQETVRLLTAGNLARIIRLEFREKVVPTWRLSARAARTAKRRRLAATRNDARTRQLKSAGGSQK